jgi:hypothetical protein
MSDFSSWSSHVSLLLDDAQRNLGSLQSQSSQVLPRDVSFTLPPASGPQPLRSTSPTLGLRGSSAKRWQSSQGGFYSGTSHLSLSQDGPLGSTARAAAPSTFALSASAVARSSLGGSAMSASASGPLGAGLKRVSGGDNPVGLGATPSYGNLPTPTASGGLSPGGSSGSTTLPGEIESRFFTIDHEIDRVRVELDKKLDTRLHDVERYTNGLLNDFRTEAQVREHEQRKLSRTELHDLRSDIQSKTEEMAVRLKDADILFAQMKSMSAMTSTKIEVEQTRREIETRINQIDSKSEATQRSVRMQSPVSLCIVCSTAFHHASEFFPGTHVLSLLECNWMGMVDRQTLASLDERIGTVQMSHSRFTHEATDRWTLQDTHFEELEGKLKLLASRDDLARAQGMRACPFVCVCVCVCL